MILHCQSIDWFRYYVRFSQSLILNNKITSTVHGRVVKPTFSFSFMTLIIEIQMTVTFKEVLVKIPPTLIRYLNCLGLTVNNIFQKQTN